MSQLLYALIVHFNLLSLFVLDIFELHVNFVCHSMSFDDVYKMLELTQKKCNPKISTCNYDINSMPFPSMYS
jgi:hypothetical protein